MVGGIGDARRRWIHRRRPIAEPPNRRTAKSPTPLSRSAAALLLALATACHSPPANPAAGPPKGEIAIRVENRSLSDVVVYLLEAGVRSRLGVAYGGATSVFFVPWPRVEAAGALRLLADPIGGLTPVATEPLAVRAGSMVAWTIERVLSQSHAAVY